MKEHGPAARCRGPRTSCFQNDLRLFQAEVAKGYMTNSALTSLSPWVGSDRLPCILPKGRRVGCQTLWFSIRNILHFTIFCFGLKIISILSFSIKFSHVPSQCWINWQRPLSCVRPSAASKGRHLLVGEYSWVQDPVHWQKRCARCPLPLFHIKSLQTDSDRREVLAKYANFAFATQSSQMNKCQPFACFHTCTPLSSEAVAKPNPRCKL